MSVCEYTIHILTFDILTLLL